MACRNKSNTKGAWISGLNEADRGFRRISVFNGSNSVVADGKSYFGGVENTLPVAVGKTATSWTVEIAIPFANIGTPPLAGDTWQIQLCGHQVADGDLWITWNPTYGSFSKKTRFANLTFLPTTN